MAVSTITSSKATVDKSDPITRCNCTVSAIAISLDSVSSYQLDEYTIKKVDASANAVIITPASGETIEGEATYTLSLQGDYVTLSPNGDGWGIVDESVTVNENIDVMASAMSGDILIQVTPETTGSSAAAVSAAIAGAGEKYTREVIVKLVNSGGDVHTWFNGTLAIAGSETTVGDGTADTAEETVTLVNGVGTCALEYIGVWAEADDATVTVTGGKILGYSIADATSVDTLIA